MNESVELDRYQVEVFYDGECPLCMREIKLLKWLDRKRRILFTDISDPLFRPQDYGKSMSEFMDEIQGRLPDGQWIVGVEVFRRLYAAVGFRLVSSVTRLPGISHTLDFGYRIFAKNRLKLTGRCTSETCKVS